MFTQYGNMMTGGQRMMGGSQLGAGGFGGVGFLAVLGFVVLAAIVVAIVIWAITRKRPAAEAMTGAPISPASPASAGDPALTIARERLARGEIDPDQYTAIVTALSGQTTSPPPQG